jgi:hypothetical protein
MPLRRRYAAGNSWNAQILAGLVMVTGGSAYLCVALSQENPET